jgi:hypothetical protein
MLELPAKLDGPALLEDGAGSWGVPRQAARPIQSAMRADARRIL